MTRRILAVFTIAFCGCNSNSTVQTTPLGNTPPGLTGGRVIAEKPMPPTLSATKSTPENVAALDKLAAANPVSGWESYSDRGIQFLVAGENMAMGDEAYIRAIADFRKAIELDPKATGGLWSNIGMAQFRLGKPKESIEAYDQAVAMNPNDARIRAMRGSSYSRAGNDASAVADYTAALALQDDPKIRFNRGNAFIRMGEGAKASADFRAIENMPTADPRMKEEARSNREALLQ